MSIPWYTIIWNVFRVLSIQFMTCHIIRTTVMFVFMFLDLSITLRIIFNSNQNIPIYIWRILVEVVLFNQKYKTTGHSLVKYTGIINDGRLCKTIFHRTSNIFLFSHIYNLIQMFYRWMLNHNVCDVNIWNSYE